MEVAGSTEGETSASLDGGSSTTKGLSNHGRFLSTRWSMVLEAGQGDPTPEARRALEELCARYWYPLYAFVRREGHGSEDAKDLTQTFFAQILERNDLSRVGPEKGRFRSFLMKSMKHLLANDYDRRTALKRGGGVVPVALDALAADERYRIEPADNFSADLLFDRRWAMTVLDHTLLRLREESEAAGKGTQFQLLKGALTGGALEDYQHIGEKLGLSENGVKSAARRLRSRYRELLKEEIAGTVANPGEIEAELRHLMDALSGSR